MQVGEHRESYGREVGRQKMRIVILLLSRTAQVYYVRLGAVRKFMNP